MANTVLDHKKVLKQFSDLIQSERDCIAMIYPNPNMESCKKKEEALNGALAKACSKINEEKARQMAPNVVH